MATANTEMDKITAIVDRTIRPALEGDGGGLELVDFKDNVLTIRYQGACCGCPGAAMTMRAGIERILKERVPEVNEVIAVD